MLKRLFLVASFLLFCAPSLVNACSCGYMVGSCQRAWRSGDMIFTGTVTRKVVHSMLLGIDHNFSQDSFDFSVSETFRGFAVEGQKITVHSAAGGSDCDYGFEVGTSYLVYASNHNGKLRTGVCMPNSRASEVPHIIRQLRALNKSEGAADLFGMISTTPVAFTDDPFDTKAMAGRQVRVIGDDFEQTTTTDDEGIFSFQDLPADVYRLEVDAPVGMSTLQRNNGELYKVDLKTQGVSGCPVSVTYSADGRIKGRVIDEDGNGVAGFVTLEPVDEKEAEIVKWRGGTVGYTTENGDFELWLLRPSQYRLIFYPKVKGWIDFRVPPSKSEIVTIGLGEHFDDFRFKVPSARP